MVYMLKTVNTLMIYCKIITTLNIIREEHYKGRTNLPFFIKSKFYIKNISHKHILPKRKIYIILTLQPA